MADIDGMNRRLDALTAAAAEAQPPFPDIDGMARVVIVHAGGVDPSQVSADVGIPTPTSIRSFTDTYPSAQNPHNIGLPRAVAETDYLLIDNRVSQHGAGDGREAGRVAHFSGRPTRTIIFHVNEQGGTTDFLALGSKLQAEIDGHVEVVDARPERLSQFERDVIVQSGEHPLLEPRQHDGPEWWPE